MRHSTRTGHLQAFYDLLRGYRLDPLQKRIHGDGISFSNLKELPEALRTARAAPSERGVEQDQADILVETVESIVGRSEYDSPVYAPTDNIFFHAVKVAAGALVDTDVGTPPADLLIDAIRYPDRPASRVINMAQRTLKEHLDDISPGYYRPKIGRIISRVPDSPAV